MHPDSGTRRRRRKFWYGDQAQCYNLGDCPTVSAGVEGSPGYSCDVLPVSGVAALCDTVTSWSALA